MLQRLLNYLNQGATLSKRGGSALRHLSCIKIGGSSGHNPATRGDEEEPKVHDERSVIVFRSSMGGKGC